MVQQETFDPIASPNYHILGLGSGETRTFAQLSIFRHCLTPTKPLLKNLIDPQFTR
ncbi:MAG: hypothetical protein DHS20C20_19120 [Ardenticatenaceae bacterium]|nr:MAG: hypothetical protein DHS20C20_19120 [Ardenticatenaceae bacterium]